MVGKSLTNSPISPPNQVWHHNADQQTDIVQQLVVECNHTVWLILTDITQVLTINLFDASVNKDR